VQKAGIPPQQIWRGDQPRARTTAVVLALLRYGLTVRDIVDALGAHPKAIEALLA
jgi:hypothetical protein